MHNISAFFYVVLKVLIQGRAGSIEVKIVTYLAPNFTIRHFPKEKF